MGVEDVEFDFFEFQVCVGVHDGVVADLFLPAVGEGHDGGVVAEGGVAGHVGHVNAYLGREGGYSEVEVEVGEEGEAG